MIDLEMQRWVLPVELSQDGLTSILNTDIIQQQRSAFEVELFAFGHLPLAWSARCFTARSEQRHKDQCELCCINYPNGRTVDSQDGQRLFILKVFKRNQGHVII